jgi:hypothetical protein
MFFLDLITTVFIIWFLLGVTNYFLGFENTVLFVLALMVLDILKRIKKW